jgi:hypothetical protein
MKTKLLRKLKKRYNWYFNKDNFPVLIDHYKKHVTLYDFEYMCAKFKYSLKDVKEKVQVPHTEWALRKMKLDILSDYGYQIDRVRYKKATRNYNKKLERS